MQIEGKIYMTTAQVAQHLGISQSRIRQLKRNGILKNFIQFSNRTLFLASEVQSYAREKKRDAR